MPSEVISLETRLAAVEERIQNAVQRCGRRRQEINLVAVTKKFSAEIVQAAYRAGMREFGENYVQEFAGKQALLGDLPGARYHLIGHLQSNKARLAADLFEVVETVDAPKLMGRLNSAAGEAGKTLDVFFEIKLSDEESKTGTTPDQIPALLGAARSCSNLNAVGLMTVPPWSEDAEASRPYFRELAALARQYQLPGLSMGMSGDFEVAIEEGATVIRLGTALFGARPKPQDRQLTTAG